MALIEWTQALETGLWPVDKQHQQLVQLINNLDEAVRNDVEEAFFLGILSELVAYTREHFRVEESLMEVAGYPGLSRHKLFHDYFVKRLKGFSERYSSGDIVVAEDLLTFLKLWLLEHVAQSDRDYIPFVAEVHSSHPG